MPWMSDPYVIGAVCVGVVNALAALLGLAQWATGRPTAQFWTVARTGQAVAALYAVFCGVYALAAEPPPDGLTWVYILTPIAVSYFAEQLRLVAAQTVLERHGFASTDELRAAEGTDRLDRTQLVTAIAHEVMLRELAVVAAGSLVIAFLAWRAVLTG